MVGTVGMCTPLVWVVLVELIRLVFQVPGTQASDDYNYMPDHDVGVDACTCVKKGGVIAIFVGGTTLVILVVVVLPIMCCRTCAGCPYYRNRYPGAVVGPSPATTTIISNTAMATTNTQSQPAPYGYQQAQPTMATPYGYHGAAPHPGANPQPPYPAHQYPRPLQHGPPEPATGFSEARSEATPSARPPIRPRKQPQQPIQCSPTHEWQHETATV